MMRNSCGRWPAMKLFAAGNTRRLYQTANAQAVGLYDRLEQTFWFVPKNEKIEDQLLETLPDV